jgi:hypothetical protein
MSTTELVVVHDVCYCYYLRKRTIKGPNVQPSYMEQQIAPTMEHSRAASGAPRPFRAPLLHQRIGVAHYQPRRRIDAFDQTQSSADRKLPAAQSRRSDESAGAAAAMERPSETFENQLTSLITVVDARPPQAAVNQHWRLSEVGDISIAGPVNHLFEINTINSAEAFYPTGWENEIYAVRTRVHEAFLHNDK